MQIGICWWIVQRGVVVFWFRHKMSECVETWFGKVRHPEEQEQWLQHNLRISFNGCYNRAAFSVFAWNPNDFSKYFPLLLLTFVEKSVCFRKCLPRVSSYCVDLSDSFFGFLSRSTSSESAVRAVVCFWARNVGRGKVCACLTQGIWCKSVLTTGHRTTMDTHWSTQIDHLFVFGQILIDCQTLVSLQITNTNADKHLPGERNTS